MREPVLLGGNRQISIAPLAGRLFHARYSKDSDSEPVTTELRSVPTGRGSTPSGTGKQRTWVREVLYTNSAWPRVTDPTDPLKNNSDKTPTSQMRETMSSGTDTEYFDLEADSNIADVSLAEPEACR